MSEWKGKRLSVKIEGSSHGKEISTTVTGLKIGLNIDETALQAFVDKRRSGKKYTTSRVERDKVELFGVKDGVVSSNEVVGIVKNTDVKKSDYGFIGVLPRPSHCDYPAIKKYGDNIDLSGGGKFSGRMTVGFMIAGGIAKQQLEKKGIFVKAYISSVGEKRGISYKTSPDIVRSASVLSDIPTLSEDDKNAFANEIEKALSSEDSVGARVECVISGINVPLGDSLFDGFEGGLSNLLFSIPGIKGVEFGDGFDLASMTGSYANDEYAVIDGKIQTLTNRNGGVLGGMTFGNDVCFAVAIKPTPSIGKPQQSVDLSTMQNEVLKISGRHDPCIAVRACCVVEAAANLYVYDLLEEYENA